MNRLSQLFMTAMLVIPRLCFTEHEKCRLAGWSFSGSFLYWTSHEQGLGFTDKPANVLTTSDFTQNSVITPSFQWEPSFRLGAGYTLCEGKWTFQGLWAHILSKAHGHKDVNSGAPDFLGIYPIWSMGPGTLSSDYVSSASASWHLHTNILDILAQYNYSCCRDRFKLMPFLSVRGASLNQKLKANYAGGTFFNGVDENTLQNRYLGLGPRFGLNLNGYAACGFSLFGRASIAPLFGRFHVKQREVYLENVLFQQNNKAYHFVLSTDYEVGLKWTRNIIEDELYFNLSASWEGQEFFWVNRFYRGEFDFFDKHRSLFLQGLTLTASLDF